jgi:hypothetical protein
MHNIIKKLFLLSVALLFFTQGSGKNCNSAITYYDRENGRLGDLLRLYIKTKWIAYRHNVPLLHKPFPFSDQFELDYKEARYNQNLLKNFQHVEKINHDPDFIDSEKSILYEVGYYPFIITPWGNALKDKKFIQLLQQLIKPHYPIQKLDLPEGIKTVALHVRKGGGADLPLYAQQVYKNDTYIDMNMTKTYADKSWPLKFPPDQYYIDQLILLSAMLNDEPLYVYLFTDDQNPSALADLYKSKINKPNIIFDYRKKGNHHSKNIIQDFFSMTQFNYLIRGASHYSEAAHIIGNYEIAIYPKDYIWEEKKLIITKVAIVFDNDWEHEVCI